MSHRVPAGPLIERSDLAGLDFSPDERLVLVTAPAGYGKTVLLHQIWLRAVAQGHIVAWLNLTAAHWSRKAFKSQLAAALAPEAAEQPTSAPVDIPTLIESRVATRDQDVFVFLDDVQVINGSPAAELLRALLKALPPRSHLLLASRERIDIEIGRLRAEGRVREIGPSQLRFNSAESLALLDALGVADHVARGRIEQACEGWPTGLALSARALTSSRTNAPAPFRISGELTQIGEYFSEETFDKAPPELRDFLLQTSILDRLGAELCEAVTLNDNCLRLLEFCEHHGFFITSMDDTRSWYRHHPLFAQFLRRRLKDTRRPSAQLLHQRACDWFLDAGLYTEAFDHALRGNDSHRAGEILDQHCTDSYGENLGIALLALMDRLPPEVQENHPRIALAAIWPLLFSWRFDRAQKLLLASRRKLDELRTSGCIAAKELDDLEHLFLHRHMMMSLYQDDMRLVHDNSEKLAREYCNAGPLVRGSIYISLIQACCEEYRLRDVESLQITAREFLDQTGHALAMLPLESVVGRARFLAGKAHEAVAPLERQVERAMGEHGGQKLGSTAAITLAEILYEQNSLAEAARLLDTHLRPGPEHGWLEVWIGACLTKARLLQIQGEFDEANDHLIRAAAVGTGGGLQRIQLFFGVERLRLLLRRGDVSLAASLARELSLTDEHPTLPVGRVTLRDEMRARGCVQVAISAGRPADALKIARKWHAFTTTVQAVRSNIHWGIVIASLLLQDGETRAARRYLRQAVLLAAPGRYIRAFLDEAPAIGHALLASPEIVVGPEAHLASFVAMLIPALEQELGQYAGESPVTHEPPAGHCTRPLSPREIEMLKMVARGLKNREIAERLATTEGTVKWQLHQAYSKLGTDRRIHAITKARELGLLLPS